MPVCTYPHQPFSTWILWNSKVPAEVASGSLSDLIDPLFHSVCIVSGFMPLGNAIIMTPLIFLTVWEGGILTTHHKHKGHFSYWPPQWFGFSKGSLGQETYFRGSSGVTAPHTYLNFILGTLTHNPRDIHDKMRVSHHAEIQYIHHITVSSHFQYPLMTSGYNCCYNNDIMF